MKSKIIRQQFISYFMQKKHQFVRSSPLVLQDDPTLLFTNAGMNQFKSIFLGLSEPEFPRAVNSQRCMRVSGKHNDLEEVGFSPSHHTFFEMLGNWSFGDYYKREAISWAWELLTDVWKLPKEKLWVTVFKDEKQQIPEDIEAAKIWETETDVDPSHILFFGRKDNFWEMGDKGPCGPCSEIHIDRGAEFCDMRDVPGHVCSVNGDCKRFMEIWNLVFIQYNRINAEKLTPLSKQHVDTGMGLERIAAILQNVESNYDTDLFLPLMDFVQEITGHDSETRSRFTVPYRVIADHVRAATFLICDGILPSNEWRGYVLRRIIRRAVRFGSKMELNEPFLFRLSDIVIDMMGDAFPELIPQRTFISQVIEQEEGRFFKTLRQGLPMVESLIGELKKSHTSVIPGKAVFKLYDTFGFPIDIFRDIARESNMMLDEKGFNEAMKQQKDRARKAWKGREAGSLSSHLERIASTVKETAFVGYSSLRSHSEILAILVEKETAREASPGKAVQIIVNPTPFYAEAGGQVGDIGEIHGDNALFRVEKSVRLTPSIFAVEGKVIQGEFHVGDRVQCIVDEGARLAAARNHTGTHILHAALRKILGDHVKQAGSLVTPDRLRFDFTHFDALSQKELFEIEHEVNTAILANYPVQVEEMDIDDALNSGVVALFGEKYGQRVRVVRIGDYSAELCGGTHVTFSCEVGCLKILSEASISSGVRRIEAITGMHTVDYIQETAEILSEITEILRVPAKEVGQRIQMILADLRNARKELSRLKFREIKAELLVRVDNPRKVNGVNIITEILPPVEMKVLRELVDNVKEKMKSGIVVLGVKNDGKAQIVVGVTDDLTKRYHAGKIVKHIARWIGGSGGGRPDMAQAGGTKPELLHEAFHRISELVS